MFAAQEDGVSALSLQRALEIGSYPTAWAMLHRLGSVLVRPGRDRLTGVVGSTRPTSAAKSRGCVAGGPQARSGKKSLVGVAVGVKQPRGHRRCRMAILADAPAASLHRFVTENVEPGSTVINRHQPSSTVITDAWQGYRGIDKLGYTHDRRSQRAARARGEDPGELLPGVHRIASLAKRWLPGTHQGSADQAHLHSHLNEFAFGFNRRRSTNRGMVFYRVLELAVGHGPVRYRAWSPTRGPRPPDRTAHRPAARCQLA
jgi:transposase-like protein